MIDYTRSFGTDPITRWMLPPRAFGRRGIPPVDIEPPLRGFGDPAIADAFLRSASGDSPVAHPAQGAMPPQGVTREAPKVDAPVTEPSTTPAGTWRPLPAAGEANAVLDVVNDPGFNRPMGPGSSPRVQRTRETTFPTRDYMTEALAAVRAGRQGGGAQPFHMGSGELALMLLPLLFGRGQATSAMFRGALSGHLQRQQMEQAREEGVWKQATDLATRLEQRDIERARREDAMHTRRLEITARLGPLVAKFPKMREVYRPIFEEAGLDIDQIPTEEVSKRPTLGEVYGDAIRPELRDTPVHVDKNGDPVPPPPHFFVPQVSPTEERTAEEHRTKTAQAQFNATRDQLVKKIQERVGAGDDQGAQRAAAALDDLANRAPGIGTSGDAELQKAVRLRREREEKQRTQDLQQQRLEAAIARAGRGMSDVITPAARGGRYRIVRGARGGGGILDTQSGIRLTFAQARDRAKADGDQDLARLIGIKIATVPQAIPGSLPETIADAEAQKATLRSQLLTAADPKDYAQIAQRIEALDARILAIKQKQRRGSGGDSTGGQPAAGRTAAPVRVPAGKTMTQTELAELARLKGVPLADARRQAEAQGYRIVP